VGFIIKYHFYRGITAESQFCNLQGEESVKAEVVLKEKSDPSMAHFYKTVRKVVIYDLKYKAPDFKAVVFWHQVFSQIILGPGKLNCQIEGSRRSLAVLLFVFTLPLFC